MLLWAGMYAKVKGQGMVSMILWCMRLLSGMSLRVDGGGSRMIGEVRGRGTRCE